MKKLTDKVTFRHGATLNHRMIQAPMLTNSGLDEAITQDTLDYYAARSQSAAMVIVEYTSVSPNGGPSRSWARDREQLAIYDEKFLPGFKTIAESLKKDGNKALLQIVHTGRDAKFRHELGGRVEVPSASVDFDDVDFELYELTDEDIRQIIKDFGVATKRAIDCGFDGVEIHGANHYLIQQFFSARCNIREDFWGGSLEKRMNFPIEVAREVFRVVKEYAPEDFIVGYRISPEEGHDGWVGYTVEESGALVKKLTEMFDFDYIHLSTLDYLAPPKLGGSDKPIGELYKEYIQAPALEILTGGISTYEKMEDALQYTDLVGLARATLIDPRIGWKLENGKEDEILTAFTAETVRDACLTPGVIELLVALAKSDPALAMPGTEYLETLATEDLGDEMTHK